MEFLKKHGLVIAGVGIVALLVYFFLESGSTSSNQSATDAANAATLQADQAAQSNLAGLGVGSSSLAGSSVPQQQSQPVSSTTSAPSAPAAPVLQPSQALPSDPSQSGSDPTEQLLLALLLGPSGTNGVFGSNPSQSISSPPTSSAPLQPIPRGSLVGGNGGGPGNTNSYSPNQPVSVTQRSGGFDPGGAFGITSYSSVPSNASVPSTPSAPTTATNPRTTVHAVGAAPLNLTPFGLHQ